MTSIFNKLHFIVSDKILFEIFTNPDDGFGFSANMLIKELNALHIETFEYLIRCQKKKLLGTISISFNVLTIGDNKDTEICRTVEKIIKTKDSYIISNTY